MEVRALSKEVAVFLCAGWVETRERMRRQEYRLGVGIDERRKRKQDRNTRDEHSPFLLQLLPQLETLDLYLSLPLMVQDPCIRRSVDGRSERVGSGAKVSWTRRAWGRTFAWAKVREVTDDMAGCTAVFVR